MGRSRRGSTSTGSCPIDDERSELLDHIEFSLPAGGLTDAVGEGPAGKTLARLFRFRHERTRLDLERHALWADRPRLTVAIAGASGLIGSHLADYLTTAGHRVIRLVRNKEAGPGEVPWDPATGALYHGALEGVDAIVNLSGVSLNGIWTSGRKRSILDSRIQATRTLAEAIARMDSPPSVFVSVSAVGAYGSRGDEIVTEGTELGEGFLADVCRAWEAAAAPAAAAGVRLVTPRFGIAVSASGGAVGAMLPAFKAGAGTRLGSGDQYWAWVELDDMLAAIEWALHDEGLEGVVNVTAPEPVTNREFTKTLGRVLRRPAAFCGAGLRPPSWARRYGRRDAPRQPAGTARAAEGARVPLRLPLARGRVALRARAHLTAADLERPEHPGATRAGHLSTEGARPVEGIEGGELALIAPHQ